MSRQNTENKDESEKAGPSSTAAIVPIQQTSDIFKLDIDCFEESFDFLPFEDLVSIGKTCKRLQQVAGYCFQQNYAAVEKRCTEDRIWLFFEDDVNCFIPFINRIFFDSEESFEFFDGRQSKFVRLKRMTFSELMITSNEIDCVKDRLRNLEFLRIDACGFDGNAYEMLFKFCTNLKRLIIQNTYEFDDAGNDWLLKSYPKMEHLEYKPDVNHVCNELAQFFELNPTVRVFSTRAYFLWNNRATVTSDKVKLDDLAVSVDFINGKKFQEFCEFLNELHDQGVYRRLHLYISNQQELIDEIAALKSLTKLYIIFDEANSITLPILNDLEEICIHRTEDISNLEDVATKFPNLKRAHLRSGTSTELLMFVKRTVNLMKIKVDYLEDGLHFNGKNNILDLIELNKQRQQLNEAEKVTIYLDEVIYLPTKWAMKDTDFSHITMRRSQSHEWNHSFYYDFA